MKGAEIVGTLLRAYKPLTALVPFQFIQMGQLPDDAPMDTVLVRSTSLIDTHFLKAGAVQHSTERVSVAVRASDYLGQVAMLEEVRAALRGFTGDLVGAQRIAIHTAGLGPDLRGPGGSFERTQDLRVSFDVAVGPAKVALGGEIMAPAVLSGSLRVGFALQGSLTASGQAEGLISIATWLSGALAGSGLVTGSIATSANLAAQLTGAGNLNGSMSRAARLSSQLAGAGALTGTLTNVGLYDPDAQTYFNAMTVQPMDARKRLISNLIAGLKADGVWANLDWLVLHAAHDAQAGRVNARQPSKVMNAVNSPIFTVDRGFAGDGTSAYLDAGESWQTSTNYTQDSATLGVWVNQGGSTDTRPIVGIVGNGATLINIGQTSTIYRLNATGNTTAASSDRLGHRTMTRTSSTTLKVYVGSSLVNTNTAITSSAPSGNNGCVLRGNTVYSSDRAAVTYSGFFSDAQRQAVDTRLAEFLTSFGAG